MKTSRFLTGLFIASMIVLSGCNDAPNTQTPTSTIKPAENKMVVLPANMTLAQAVIHPPRSKDGFGTMEQQTIGAYNGLYTLLQKQGLTLGNVMGVRVVLAPNTDGSIDYDTYMAAFNKFFGTKKLPAVPVHSISAAHSLPVAGQLIMLEANIAMPVKTTKQKKAKQ
ncbi:MAG: hypothetical protein JKX72_05705 [Robiginitomaculum sp.]|nr:hypothetical protein [Robiginitomaculum sp.]